MAVVFGVLSWAILLRYVFVTAHKLRPWCNRAALLAVGTDRTSIPEGCPRPK